VDATVAHGAVERLDHRRATDRVEVAEQHDGATSAAPAVDEDVHAAWLELVQFGAQAVLRRPVRNEARRSRFPRARRIE